MAARSPSRYQSELLRASRETSKASTMPTPPSATASVSSPNPDRATALAPLRPRSASMTRTAGRAQPSATARSASAYWRSVDSRLRSIWEALDWRM